MNAPVLTRFLQVAEHPVDGGNVAVLGRDIRTTSEQIAAYCVTRHAPIYEDLATLVESMAYCDRLIPRKRSTGWSRTLELEIPVYESACFGRAKIQAALTEAAWFLTGDRWHFNFVPRHGSAPGRQGRLCLSPNAIAQVIPFSDGLDSFAQARLSMKADGRERVMLVRSGLERGHSFQGLPTLRVSRRFGGARLRETTYRTRPLVFYTFAAIGAVITGAGKIVIGESGQGAIGPACLPFADEWWFRSAHPGFTARWATFLTLVLGTPIWFDQPQLWRTKGEVLTDLADSGLADGWERTTSCATRPIGRYTRRACGVCGGCLLRTVAAHAAKLPLCEEDFAFDLMGAEAVARDRQGGLHPMTVGERAVAVRAIAAMAEFARLAEDPNREIAIQRESELIEPRNPRAAGHHLERLLSRHHREWHDFLNRLPRRSWVSDIVSQL